MSKPQVIPLEHFEDFLYLAARGRMHVVKINCGGRHHILTAGRPDKPEIYRYAIDESDHDTVVDLVKLAGFIPREGEWTAENCIMSLAK